MTRRRGDRGGVARHPEALRMPPGVRWPLAGLLLLAIAGGLYLIAVRGEALLLDLSRLAAYCF